LMLSACTSTEHYEAGLDPWLGKSEKELVMGWGVPDKQYHLDPRTKMISYISYDTITYPSGMTTCFGMAGTHMLMDNCAGPFPRTAESFYCETIFTITGGRVTRWGHKGNNCRS
jgi:hypothetical protein